MAYSVKLSRRRGASYAEVVPPADLPAGAVGFVARRPDRPERLALYRADGSLSNSFGMDEGIAEARAAAAAHGFRLDDAGALLPASQS